jgi:flagellar protein FlbD
VTKFDGKEILLNADWIQSVEETPDTLITLTNGYKLIVRNPSEEILTAYLDHKRRSHPGCETFFDEMPEVRK